jgi:hypothetical protein
MESFGHDRKYLQKLEEELLRCYEIACCRSEVGSEERDVLAQVLEQHVLWPCPVGVACHA